MEQKNLREAYLNEPTLKAALDGMGESVSFENSWKLFGNRFPHLCTFAVGIAKFYPGKTRVESDFSVIGWGKDEYRSAIMNFSLEGIIHSKQFKDIQTLRS